MILVDLVGAFIIILVALIGAFVGMQLLLHYSHAEEKPVVGKWWIRTFIVVGVVCLFLTLFGLPIDLLSSTTR